MTPSRIRQSECQDSDFVTSYSGGGHSVATHLFADYLLMAMSRYWGNRSAKRGRGAGFSYSARTFIDQLRAGRPQYSER